MDQAKQFLQAELLRELPTEKPFAWLFSADAVGVGSSLVAPSRQAEGTKWPSGKAGHKRKAGWPCLRLTSGK